MKRLQQFQISEDAKISEAFVLIELNGAGGIFATDAQGTVVGLATDGDIRRWLMKAPDLSAPIRNCLTRDFVFARENASREQILKLLDHRIHIVPVLNSQNRLVDVLSRGDFPLKAQQKTFARARAPVRVSFGGGGTDLTHYFVEHGGAVMNATISIYSHASLRKRDDQKVMIYSRDLDEKIEADNLDDALKQGGRMSLLLSLIRLIKPTFGFDLQIGSDFPVGSGLGGSAAVLASIIGCFNQFREDQWDNYEMAEIAFQAERITLDVAGGWQDQYATIFGGFNFMEFTQENNIVHPLRISSAILRELEASMLLTFAGGSHSSGDLHRNQKEKLLSSERIRSLVAANKALTYQQKTFLLRGHLIDFGKSLDETWQLKRQFSDQISSPELDRVYDLAMANGAMGGKLLGAGGGGFFMFYVKPFQRFKLEKALAEIGLKPHPFCFDHEGLQSWTVREGDLVGGPST